METLTPLFADRTQAGRALAKGLARYGDDKHAIVLALPRGGVPVAAEVAKALRLPLDVFPVRKLGVPGYGELAMGAIAPGGVRVLNRDVIDTLDISAQEIDSVAAAEQAELQRRQRVYRGNRPPTEITGRTVILVDDGLATGATMEAAIEAVRRLGAANVVVAVPVAPQETCQRLARRADDVVYLASPEPFMAIGVWYDAFGQMTDQQVTELLSHSSLSSPSSPIARRAE